MSDITTFPVVCSIYQLGLVAFPWLGLLNRCSDPWASLFIHCYSIFLHKMCARSVYSDSYRRKRTFRSITLDGIIRIGEMAEGLEKTAFKLFGKQFFTSKCHVIWISLIVEIETFQSVFDSHHIVHAISYFGALEDNSMCGAESFNRLLMLNKNSSTSRGVEEMELKRYSNPLDGPFWFFPVVD